MGISYFGGATSAISTAFDALKSEEAELRGRIEFLTKRLGQVQQAVEAMRPLLRPEITAQELTEDDEEEQAAGTPDSNPLNPFAGLKFSLALHKHMLANRTAAVAPDIAKAFEEAGWKFSNPQTTHKTNQVGVTLRRFEGKLFARDESGKWYAIPV